MDHSQGAEADRYPGPATTNGSVHDQSTMDRAVSDHAKMPGMDHGAMGDAAMMAGEGSSSARLPSKAMHGLHFPVGASVMLMLHGYAWGVHTGQSGPRGDVKLYVQSMAIADYRREFTGGRFMARAMLSLEPAIRTMAIPTCLLPKKSLMA